MENLNELESVIAILIAYSFGYLMAGMGMIIDNIQEMWKAIRKRKAEKKEK